MNCPNCGTVNNEGSKFCIRCGNSLTVQPTVSNVASQPMNQSIVEQQPTYQPQHVVDVASNNGIAKNPFNYFMYMLMVLLKPTEHFKKEQDKLVNTKNTLIFSVIVAGIMMVLNLLKSMISVIITKTLDFSTFQYKTTFQFSNLKKLDYLSLIGKNFLIYLAIIFAIAGVYYLASLIIKKNLNFIKLVAITTTSILPFVALGMIASPLLGKIWGPLGLVLSIVGIVYSFVIFFSLVNNDLKFESLDKRIYFSSACLSILGVAGYYLFIKLLTSGIAGQLGNLLEMFK